ncbi:MAG: SPOR domain-containing protein [Acidobacteriota bacterium]|nr:SPOR domain-containing protein [Acidobacteriota bacterium]
MSEDTHYQVAMTNGQVLTAFAVLLAALIAVFFAGVWLGQGSGEETPAYAYADAAAPDLPKVNGEYSFFSAEEADEPSHPKPETPVAAAQPPPSRPREPTQDRTRQPKRAEKRRSTEAVTVAEPTPPPEAMEPKQVSTTPPPAAPHAKAEPVAEAPAVTAGFTIQVFASADKAKAERLVNRLVDADFMAFLAPSENSEQAMYRVRVGPLPNRQLAETQAAELEHRWGLESWISPSAP